MCNMEMDLYLAIKNNNYAKVVEVLKKHNLIEYEYFDDTITYLALAIINNNSMIANELIKNGADVNKLSYVSYGWPQDQMFVNFEPALITATRHGNPYMCELLLKNNAKLNKTDSFSMSALHWASSLNLVDIVELLFRFEANPNILDLKNQTPLEKAIQNNHTEIVRIFVSNLTLNYKYREYLLAAIKLCNGDMLRTLLTQIENGKVNFDINQIDDSIGSLLHYAVLLSNIGQFNNQQNRNQSETLIQTDLLSSSRCNSLVTYSQLANEKIIESLIRFGIGLNLVNKLGETALHMCRNTNIARILLDNGAKMNVCEITGKMPLFTFICRANYDMCVEMIKNGCDVENKDRLGNSLLYALINSNAPIKLILLLLDAGVELNKEEWIQRKQYPKRLLQKYPKLVKLIEWRLKNPPSLKELARKTLRNHLNKINSNKSIVNSVTKLEKIIPSSLQDYVLLNLNRKFGPILMK